MLQVAGNLQQASNVFKTLICAVYIIEDVFVLFFSHSHPGYFGKVGMRHFHKTNNKYYRPIINLEKLWSLVSEQTRLYYKDKPDGPVPVIDVVRAVSLLG